MKHRWLVVVFVCACGGGNQAPASSTPAPEPTPAPVVAQPDPAARNAEIESDNAAKEAKEAMDAVAKIEVDLAALDVKVGAAVDSVVAAQNDADRAAAKARLVALQTDKRALEVRMADAKAKAAKAQRMKGVTVSKECIDNPLAKGCE